jgi:hypothetical protein
MVDLPVGHVAALAAAALLTGCAGGARPALPQASNTVRQAMRAALQSGDRVALTRAALLLARMGGGMSDHGFEGFSAQLDDATLAAIPAWWRRQAPSLIETLRLRFHDNQDPRMAETPQPAAEVPPEFRLVEGIAYDAQTDRLFAGTVIDGRLGYLQDGRWHEVAIGLPRSGLFGMAIDPKRRLLWIATGAVDQTAVREAPMAGLIAVDLDRLTVVERVPGAGGVPGDVAVGPDGAVYLSDGRTGALHVRRPGAGLADLVPAGRFKSTQGMAVSKDGKHLYVADYGTGLWVVRLRDGKVDPIGLAGPAMLDGIDGLLLLRGQNALIATQNGTAPRRIIKMMLSPDGAQIARLETLEIVPAKAGDPTLATLKGHEIWFVGDGQWERYGEGGAIADGKPARATPILKLDVDSRLVD